MLEDKAVVVTGAGRGIGQATAALAARLGAKVVVNDIDAAAAEETATRISAHGGEAIVHADSVGSWDGARRLVEACTRRFGRIDGLVNNAAIFRPGLFETLEESPWRETMDVNVLGPAFAMTHAAKAMLASGGGAIVNVISGSHQGAPDMAPYGTSKGALASLIYCGAVDLGPRGVRVNGVSPVAATRMEQEASDFGQTVGRAAMVPSLPPESNATVVCFLLSDESAAFNGQILRIERDGVSILGHPTVLQPYPRVDTGDYDQVRDAVLSQLTPMLQPLGVRYGRLAHD